MTISLSPEAQRLVEEKLKSGAYRSADDVIHAALHALTDAESFGDLDAETLGVIDRAEEQIEREEVYDWKDVCERVRARFLGA
jgi:putative addiction module CopG family antidote